MSSIVYSYRKTCGPSVFQPKEARNFAAACRAQGVWFRVERGGGFKARWYCSARFDSVAERLSLQLMLGDDPATVRDANALATKPDDSTFLRSMGIEP
jgi:hypothetical protein